MLPYTNEPDLKGQYAGHSDAELILILRDGLQYDPSGQSDVVKEVRKELGERDLVKKEEKEKLKEKSIMEDVLSSIKPKSIDKMIVQPKTKTQKRSR